MSPRGPHLPPTGAKIPPEPDGTEPALTSGDPESAAVEEAPLVGHRGADADGALDGPWASQALPDAEPERSRARRLRRRGAVAAIALAAVAAGVIALTSGSSSPARAGTGVPVGETTTIVTRRTLSESATVDGTLGYGEERALYNRLAGTYTWLPAAGATIGRGGVLYRLDNRPVVLMYGSVPAYRALHEGVSEGPDVVELNANLIALGYDPYGAIVDDADYSSATASAVRRWQHAEGLPETGSVELGRVIFVPGAQRVAALHVSLGQDPPGATPPTTPTTPAPATPTAPTKPPSPSHDGSTHKHHKHPSHKPAHKPGASHPSGAQPGSSPKAPSSPSSGSPGSSDPGSGEKPGSGNPAAGSPEQVMSTTASVQLVQVKLKAEQQQLAHIGERVPVTLPGGDVVEGRITAVGTVATSGQGNNGEKGGSGENEAPTVPAIVALDHRVAHLDAAPVSVELVKSIRREVLAVPAAALIATAGGGYAVEALQAGRRILLPVTPGMFADGYVQIEGAGIREGLNVVEAQ